MLEKKLGLGILKKNSPNYSEEEIFDVLKDKRTIWTTFTMHENVVIGKNKKNHCKTISYHLLS